jgi:hypothetical protein
MAIGNGEFFGQELDGKRSAAQGWRGGPKGVWTYAKPTLS